MLGRANRNARDQNKGFFARIFGGVEANPFSSGDVFADLRASVFDDLYRVLISCMYCWNHLDQLSHHDYNFTRFGQFAYSPDHQDIILKELRKIPANPAMRVPMGATGQQAAGQPQSAMQSFKDTLTNNWCNPIQRKLLGLLRPIAQRHL